MTTVLAAAAGAAAFLGFSARWHWWRGKISGLPVLMYHKIGIAPRGSDFRKLWVSPKKFAAHVDYLLKQGYTPVLFSDVAKALRKEAELPQKPVLITFDDGYRNNYTEAYRILREKGAKGNIFIVWDTIGRHNAWHDPVKEPWIQMLTVSEIKEMLDSGVMDIGSHTMSHASLPDIELSTAAWQLRESKKRLEDAFGREITAFAYPYGAGALNPEIRREALNAGYLMDFSIKQGISPWPWAEEMGPLKRLFIHGGENKLDFHLQITRGKSKF